MQLTNYASLSHSTTKNSEKKMGESTKSRTGVVYSKPLERIKKRFGLQSACPSPTGGRDLSLPFLRQFPCDGNLQNGERGGDVGNDTDRRQTADENDELL